MRMVNAPMEDVNTSVMRKEIKLYANATLASKPLKKTRNPAKKFIHASILKEIKMVVITSVWRNQRLKLSANVEMDSYWTRMGKRSAKEFILAIGHTDKHVQKSVTGRTTTNMYVPVKIKTLNWLKTIPLVSKNHLVRNKTTEVVTRSVYHWVTMNTFVNVIY
jgi:hypothetical protein